MAYLGWRNTPFSGIVMIAAEGSRRCHPGGLQDEVPVHRQSWTQAIMADTAGHDVHFESADAGASLTYPQQAGTVRKNGFLVIKGRPCKVSVCSMSAELRKSFDDLVLLQHIGLFHKDGRDCR